MPAPLGRDLLQTREQLEAWFPTVLPDGARNVRVGELTGPGGTGFSSDTLIFDLRHEVGGETIERGYVARVHPSGFQLFPEYDLPAQFRVMRALWDTPVPVPEMLFEERSGEVIGQPFYLMSKVVGQCPADSPPYTAEGWVKELPEADQASLWDGYLDILSEIHALDPLELKLDFLAKPELGATPLDQEIAYYENFYRGRMGDETHPYVEPALGWLRENKPPQPATPSLLWGDSRIGNMIFDGPQCLAVIDWEMARRGDPMMDLGWGLFLSRYHTEGNGVPRLPGFRDREASIAYYEQKSGRSAEHVAYYEVLAGMRFSVILIGLGKQMKHYEMLPEDVNFEVENPVSMLHGKQLEALGVL